MTIVEKNVSRFQSFVLCTFAYIAALGIAYIVTLKMTGHHPITLIAGADVAGTIIIFLFSYMTNNSSIYDPYWSLAPIPIALYFGCLGLQGDGNILRIHIVAALVTMWSLRLTWNWIRQWQGIYQEDWRYVDFRDRCGKGYWMLSFWGIHFFPTVMVFLGCLSLYPALVTGTRPFNVLDIIATIITAGAILIEAISDKQLMKFVESKPESGTIMEKGLWKFSRHPNYFGEVTFWWGLFLFSIAADSFHWWTIIGPGAINIMFLYISIPMMEKRSIDRRPHYNEHQKKVSILVPWPPKTE